MAEVANQVDVPIGTSLFAKDKQMEQYWFTVKEVAEMENVSEKTIRNYIKLGYLKAHRRGPRNLVISIDSIGQMYRPNGSYLRKF
jgi:excisionase family DNA binding protein